MANLRRKAVAGALTVVATLVATCGIAFANAANPLADSHGQATQITGTVTLNPDGSYHVDTGSVAVTVGGTWNWGTLSGSSEQNGCDSRYGVGWAVDWAGISSTQTVPGQSGSWAIGGKNGTKWFHVFGTDLSATGDVYPFEAQCQQVDADGFPEGPWSSQHTYAQGSTIPKVLCVSMYDLHGSPGDPKVEDFNPATNGDNSVKTNDFDPTVNSQYCFTPVIVNGPSIATTATATATLGSPISDSATLSGANESAGGTITFTAFANDTCTGDPAFTSSPITVSGNGTYGPVSFTPTVAGTYNWIAAYSGDDSNAAASGECGDEGETSVVTQLPGTQSLTGHIYDCSDGATTEEVNGGTLSATGPTTVDATANPLNAADVDAGDYVVSAVAPEGFHFVECDSDATIGDPTHATDNVTVPEEGTGEALFYVAPDIAELSITVVKTNDANGDGTFTDDETGETGGDVAFRATITNNSPAAVVIDSISDEWPGEQAFEPECEADVVGETLAANGGSVTCDFIVTDYVPSADDGAKVNTVTVDVCEDGVDDNCTSDDDDSTVRGGNVLMITVDKTNDANGDGTFNDDETGTNGNDVTFQATITNHSAVPVVVESISDIWPGATAFEPECAAQVVGVTLAANGGSVTCEFTVENYVPPNRDGAKVNTVAVNACEEDNDDNCTTDVDDSTVRGVEVLGEVITPTPTAPVLPRTGPSSTAGLLVAGLALILLGALMMRAGVRLADPDRAFAWPTSVVLAMPRHAPLLDRDITRTVGRRRPPGRWLAATSRRRDKVKRR